MNLGSAMLLYINDVPVGCLTSNTLSESISFIRTCKTTAKGATTNIPDLYGYSIAFECVMVIDNGLMTYEDIKTLARNRERFDWAMINSAINQGDAGQAFVENLEISASSEDFVKFTGTLTGYGAIVNDALIYYVWYQAPNTPVDEGDNYVFTN